MFFKKKDKKPKAPMPGWVETEDGKFRLDFYPTDDAPPPQPEASEPVLERLYVISRDNINLEEAQQIVLNAAMTNAEKGGDFLVSRTVPLVWASAYPDELFGEVSLRALLVAYVKKQEGDQYLNSESKIASFEGNYKGYDYYIVALVSGV